MPIIGSDITSTIRALSKTIPAAANPNPSAYKAGKYTKAGIVGIAKAKAGEA